jgi:muconolactone D-isomerase
MEFLVEFELAVPDGTGASEVEDREEAEASAATTLADEGHLLRVWKPRGSKTVMGLYRADDDSQLKGLLASLPLRPWMDVTVRALGRIRTTPRWPLRRTDRGARRTVSSKPLA